MYKSPIEMSYSFSDSFAQRFSEETDKLVLTACFNVGVKLDKAELIKALEYDSDQYEKGYRDGKEENTVAHAKWVDNGEPYCSRCGWSPAPEWSCIEDLQLADVYYCPHCGARMDGKEGGDK